MNIDQAKLGEVVRFLRKSRGLSQHQLATMAGLSVNYISLFENGRRGISIENLNSIAKALQFPGRLIPILEVKSNKGTPVIAAALLKELIANFGRAVVLLPEKRE